MGKKYYENKNNKFAIQMILNTERRTKRLTLP